MSRPARLPSKYEIAVAIHSTEIAVSHLLVTLLKGAEHAVEGAIFGNLHVSAFALVADAQHMSTLEPRRRI
jgi:hypothetical protein